MAEAAVESTTKEQAPTKHETGAEEKASEAKPAEGAKGAKQEKGRDGKREGKKGGGGFRDRAPSGPLAYGSGYRLNVKHFTENTAGTNEKLKALFEPCGKVTDAQVKIKDDGKSRGFGFVIFSTEAEANKAVAELNGKELDGKALFVGPAERREGDSKGGDKGKGKGKHAALAAAQAAYTTQYMMMHQAYMRQAAQTTTGEEYPAPGEYHGILKSAVKYGVKKHYLVCSETYQYYGDHVNIDKDLLPAGSQDGDTLKFTAVMKFGEWKPDAIAPAAAKGYPKASQVSKA